VNVAHPILGTDHPPLGFFCGIILPCESNGGEFGGLFCPSPPLAITLVVLLCHGKYFCVKWDKYNHVYLGCGGYQWMYTFRHRICH
jgi:hypothetical protein